MVMYITLDKGTMFGGKSSQLWNRYRYYEKKRKLGHLRMLILKHALDTRYDEENHIVTHDGKKIPCVPTPYLRDINPKEYDVILIDEGQWFQDLYDWIEKHFLICDTRIHIAGLNGCRDQKNFGDINRISPFCSEEQIHHGMCAVCGEEAPFTRCRNQYDERDVPGGDDEYFTVCHKHIHTPAHEIEIYRDK